MISNKDIALQLADFLLQIKAVKLQPNKPFTWSSGWISPIYCDNRLTLSHPKVRTFIRQEISRLIDQTFEKPDIIAGVATGGIAIGVLVAQELGLPFVYIRPKAKGHGLENLIEGKIESGQTAVVIEDLISTGQSSLNAVKALKHEGVIVKGMVSIFDYGFEVAKKAFAEEQCKYYALSDYEHLIQQALKSKYIDKQDVDSLKSWKSNPDTWGTNLKIA
jgi:orotate phosphoribosyltransferase